MYLSIIRKPWPPIDEYIWTESVSNSPDNHQALSHQSSFNHDPLNTQNLKPQRSFQQWPKNISRLTKNNSNHPFVEKIETYQPESETGASWVSEYLQLENEIRVRHYSQKTLKTYRGWVRQFQAFTLSKKPSLLTTDDVKEFLTFLAVKRCVSATTQNQAFNDLHPHCSKRDHKTSTEPP